MLVRKDRTYHDLDCARNCNSLRDKQRSLNGQSFPREEDRVRIGVGPRVSVLDNDVLLCVRVVISEFGLAGVRHWLDLERSRVN